MSIYIKLLEFSDADALYMLRNKNREFFQAFEPVRTDSDFTYNAVVANIAHAMENAEKDTGYSFGIFLTENGELIGRINLSNVARGFFQSGNIGYFLDEDYNGRGYMTEAVSLLLAYAFETLGLHRIQAAVMPRNVGSRKCLEKNGFFHEGLALFYLQINGVWEDHDIYSLTIEHFKK